MAKPFKELYTAKISRQNDADLRYIKSEAVLDVSMASLVNAAVRLGVPVLRKQLGLRKLPQKKP